MTNKLIGVLRYHQDHKLIKSEVVGFEDLDLIAASEDVLGLGTYM